MKISAYISWAMLAAVVVLWGISGYVIYEIGVQKETHVVLIASAQERAIKDSSLVKLRALLNETRASRDTVASAIPNDVLFAVDLIDAAGKVAGVDVEISNAQPGASNDKAGVTSVAFVIRSEGSFARLARLTELLGSLPAPSTIEHLELTLNEKGKSWNMSARLKLLTAGPTSS
jgi:Tfp pilus assembly protein PilO